MIVKKHGELSDDQMASRIHTDRAENRVDDEHNKMGYLREMYLSTSKLAASLISTNRV